MGHVVCHGNEGMRISVICYTARKIRALEVRMRIFLDIDGTIACDNQALYLMLCNLALKLGIAGERLVGLTYDEFYALPEVTAYRERVGEQRYETNVRII